MINIFQIKIYTGKNYGPRQGNPQNKARESISPSPLNDPYIGMHDYVCHV